MIECYKSYMADTMMSSVNIIISLSTNQNISYPYTNGIQDITKLVPIPKYQKATHLVYTLSNIHL
jgi:hypothetical protein